MQDVTNKHLLQIIKCLSNWM